jgi:hypothetical protein
MVALLSSMITAVYIYSNQILRLPASLLMVYRGLVLFAVMYAVSIPFGISLSNKFYYLALIQGLLIGYGDNAFFRSSKAFGAEITGVIQPLSIGVTFFAWLIISPLKFNELFSNSLDFPIIVLCLIGVVAATLVLRKVKTNKKALRYMFPVLFVMSAIDILNKTIMSLPEDVSIFEHVYSYTMWTALSAGIYNLFLYMRSRHEVKALFERKTVAKALVLLVIVILNTSVKAYAMSLTPNPAYTASIIFLFPVWIIFANKIYYRINKDKTYVRINIKALVLLLTSIIILILMTR